MSTILSKCIYTLVQIYRPTRKLIYCQVVQKSIIRYY